MLKQLITAAAMAPFLLACSDDTTGPDGASRVAVRFQAVKPGASATLGGSGLSASDQVRATGPITLTGTNGTLIIEDIRLIVSEIELERADGECFADDDDECEEFEGGPFVVNLLDGSADATVAAIVPAGTYTELEFEVEDLDIDDDADDDDDARERQRKQALLAQLRQAYPAFPSDASMVVRGTFNGEPFTVYFEAEIEVEQEFATPFRVPEDGSLLVNLSPAAWFRQGTQVMNLRALNGQTIAFEAEFEKGVLEVEFDD